MNKILIDRALLERAVYRLELAYDADAPIVCDLSSVLAAPSGTPAMPVKAYYHEAPNEYGGLNKSVGLEVRKQFNDAPLVLEADAMECITYLEAEVAKRDARIVELELEVALRDQALDRHVEYGKELRAELAAIKAQGVVMPERLKPSRYELHDAAVDAWNSCLDEVARLNAAPVQQVSVPDEMRSLAQRLREYNQNPHHINPMSEAFHILVADAANALSAACVPKEIAAAITWSEHLLFECGALTSTRAPSVHVYNKTFAAVNEARAMLYAAPAAPAADAWIPVSERLPESGEPVQVWCEGAEQPGLAWISRHADWSGEWVIPEPQAIGYESITHWMPLPAGPVAHHAQGVQ